MTGRRVVFALMATIAAGTSATAAPLTCTDFRDRLSGALVAGGDPGAEAPDYKEARTTDMGGSHVNWNTSALSGSLTCKAGDRFQEFYISLDVTSRDKFVEQLKRLIALDGAAICSISTAAPAACSNAGKLLMQDALQQMGAGFKRRTSNPSGTSSRMLWPDVKTEFTAAPSLLTFSMASAEGASVDTTRRPLPALPKSNATP